MTEDEWLSRDEPMAMMNFLIEQEDHRGWRRWVPSFVSTWVPISSRNRFNRRTYLLACGLIRQWIELYPQEVLGNGHVKFSNDLLIEEDFADGHVSLETLLSTNAERRWHWPTPWHLVSNVIRQRWIHPLGISEKLHLQCTVMCCIFNPFRPVTIDPAWNTAAFVQLAQAIYEERAFDHLPILADALEGAGCTHPDILAHCRGPGPHVRGCWVLDLLTGRQ